MPATERLLADPKVMFVLALAALVCLLPDRAAQRSYQASFRLGATPLMTLYCLALYVLSCVAVVEGGFNPFIYFQF